MSVAGREGRGEEGEGAVDWFKLVCSLGCWEDSYRWVIISFRGSYFGLCIFDLCIYLYFRL